MSERHDDAVVGPLPDLECALREVRRSLYITAVVGEGCQPSQSEGQRASIAGGLAEDACALCCQLDVGMRIAARRDDRLGERELKRDLPITSSLDHRQLGE